ncbi:N-acetyltransferase [Nocardia yamanashiensis]|uniref:GNAT family N-acetyltransferase n=1 Tax=Nocardia yamanashiensis TaxID=209247 RepID=UPI001E547DA9|nr:GNAT family N-acetyltransferase [Nocardia yamanashiensis]UGT41779.1 N-acetyltransferase [Nocardia yamanashiensis]
MTDPIVTQVTTGLPTRYEIGVDGVRAGQTDYVDTEKQRIFFHTEIGQEFGGRGLASTLIRAALDSTREQGLRIVPVCPFVKAFVEKHHDFDDILDKVTPEAIATVEAALN